MKSSKNLVNVVQLIVDNKNMDIVFASKNLNPMLTWVKFILTDDKPNANNQRIPKSEFSNLIRSGLYMPIKMALEEISEGHEETYPIGVITHLKEDGDKIRGLAALWNMERPDAISVIKEHYAEGKSLDLSWEIGYTDEYFEGDIKNLTGCELRATTLVGIPAYQGRTIITDVEDASETEKNSEEEKFQMEKELKELKKENETLKTQISTLESAQATEEDKTKLEEYDELKQFKSDIETASARIEKLEAIRKLFVEAGANETKITEFFTEEKEDLLLSMSEVEGAIEVLVSQFASQISEEEEEEESEEDLESEEATTKIPRVPAPKDVKDMSMKELAEAFRQVKKDK